MLLPQHRVEVIGPRMVVPAELRVLIAVRGGLFVFLPQELQRHALAPELTMDGRPLRKGSRLDRWDDRAGEEPGLEHGLVDLGRERPGEITRAKAAQILGSGWYPAALSSSHHAPNDLDRNG